jgi:hypothetical protein
MYNRVSTAKVKNVLPCMHSQKFMCIQEMVNNITLQITAYELTNSPTGFLRRGRRAQISKTYNLQKQTGKDKHISYFPQP